MTENLAYRNAMARLGAAVNIVTSNGAAGRHGMTASAVCSVTDDPPTLLVCVNQASTAHGIFKRNGVLCVNVLAAKHGDVSQIFSQTGLTSDERFDGLDWEVQVTGAPVLSDALASFDCRIIKTSDVGSHTVFVCQVAAVDHCENQSSLIYFNRSYHSLACLGAN